MGTHTRRRLRKGGNFGMRESMKWEERGNFPEKKFQKAWGERPEGFFGKKFFLGSENTKFCATSVAPRAAGLRGGGAPTYPQNGKFAANKATSTAQTVQTV